MEAGDTFNLPLLGVCIVFGADVVFLSGASALGDLGGGEIVGGRGVFASALGLGTDSVGMLPKTNFVHRGDRGSPPRTA